MTSKAVIQFNKILTLGSGLCIIFSESRLSTYLSATNEDKIEALKLYTLNMSLSESLYSFLCIFEITLRNRISNILVKEFGDNWFEEKAGKWLNGKAATEWHDKNGNTQRARLLKQIDKGFAEVKGKTVTLLRWLLNKVPEIITAGRVF